MKLISFDVETSGTLPEYALQPFRVRTGDAWLTSVAWHTTEEDLDFGNRMNWDRTPNLEDVRYILKECAAKGVRVVAWNTPFDVAWLIALGLREEVMACKWLDAMLLQKHLMSNPTFERYKHSYGLKSAVAAHFPQHKDYAEDVDFHATDPDTLHTLRRYNKKDAVFTYGLAKMFWHNLDAKQRRVALLEAECIPLVAESMVEGLSIDRDAVTQLDDTLNKRARAAVVQLKLLYAPDITEEVLASPKQLSKLLYGEWGLRVPFYTETGSPSTDRKSLLQLSEQHKGAALINEVRECTGNRTKFAANTLESINYNGDDRTRPNARIFGTYTGRMTYSSKQGRGKDTRQTGVALHQWKRDPEFRKTIKAPDGYQLLEFDFAGQEFRWMAVAADDQTMLGLCQPGQDAHAYMGARINGLDYPEIRKRLAAGDKEAKAMRQLGKVANLSLQYRTSAKRLREVAMYQYDLDMSETEARAIHGTYQMTYYNVPRYWRKQIAWVRGHKYVDNMIGRRVYFKNLCLTGTVGQQNIPWEYASTAVNYPIQSMGAEQKYLALAILKNHLSKYDARFYFELHDGLFVVVPNDKAEKAAHELKQILSYLPYGKAWGLQLPIGFPVDAKIGPSWGELKEI